MGSSYILTESKALQLELPEALRDFVNYLGDRVAQFGENYSIIGQKGSFAKALNKDVRTITRYLRELEEKKVIQTATKRGKAGGTVIVFNTEMLDFGKTNNVFTEDTKTAEEIKDLVFPKAKKKATKKSYRPKHIIEEERYRKQLRQSEDDKLNDLLEGMEYPTKEFFMQTTNPELFYRAYLASRMYNFYAVYYPEMQMINAESKGNMGAYLIADTHREDFRYFDCLKKRFIGTPTFNHFIKFADVMLGNEVKPEAYLTVQYDYMEYLASVKANNVKLPFINALLSQKTVGRWLDTEDYKKGFRKEHPYYAVSPDTVSAKGMSYPIMLALSSEFQNPFNEVDAFQAQIDANTDLFMAKTSKAVVEFKNTVDEEIEATTELNDIEKATLSKFVKQEVANHMGVGQPRVLYLLSSLPQMQGLKLKKLKEKPTNLRPYYHTLGNTDMIESIMSNSQRATHIKRGYQFDFSLYGGVTFMNIAKTLRNARGFEIDYAVLETAMSKFGAHKIPLDDNGFLDVNAIQKKVISQEAIDAELTNGIAVIKDPKRRLDLFGDLWYDISEEYVGQSSRDGKWKGTNR